MLAKLLPCLIGILLGNSVQPYMSGLKQAFSAFGAKNTSHQDPSDPTDYGVDISFPIHHKIDKNTYHVIKNSLLFVNIYYNIELLGETIPRHVRAMSQAVQSTRM